MSRAALNPRSPHTGTSPLPRLNFRNAPVCRVAMHNVDMIGSHSAGRWASHLIRFAFPVFRTR